MDNMNRKTYILGSGLHKPKIDGVIRVDILKAPGVDLVHNLNNLPWPIADGEAIHVNAEHLIEHLENVPAFMDEAWRILNPGGSILIKVPDAADIDMAWADPTHKRAFRKHSFINYFTVEGIHKFGYAKHAWSILHLKTDGKEITAHMTPIPDEFLTDKTLKRLSYATI